MVAIRNSVTLSNGVIMPLVGLGTWQASSTTVKAAVHAAINAGYRLIDTAYGYRNEDSIGEAIQEVISAGQIKREDLFITTKGWSSHLHPDDIEDHLRGSLKRLKLDYVDLYLAHMPVCYNNTMTEPRYDVTVGDIWQGFELLYNKKMARSIGVSNWSGEQIERTLRSATVPIHNCQVELNLYFPQHELHKICRRNNISVTSYASLGSPGRTNVKVRDGKKLDWAPAANPLDDPNVRSLATKYRKTPAQVLLRYILERGIAVIPKSANSARIMENFQVFDFSLCSEEIRLLESTGYNQRLFVQDFMAGHPEDPFKDERK